MSGHNKWAQIKHKKAVTDAKKSKVFSKLTRFIAVEAKLAKGSIDAPGLRAAIEKAKKANMPAENIERAIKKATEVEGRMELITYEAYGLGGVGLIIETLTDNKNRTAQSIKHILAKNNWTLGSIGSVVWSFVKEKTPEGTTWKPITYTQVSDTNLELLDKLVDELEELDDVQDIYTNAEQNKNSPSKETPY